MRETPERPPSRFETVIEGLDKVDLTGLLSLAVALVGGAVALGRRLIGTVRRRG